MANTTLVSAPITTAPVSAPTTTAPIASAPACPHTPVPTAKCTCLSCECQTGGKCHHGIVKPETITSLCQNLVQLEKKRDTQNATLVEARRDALKAARKVRTLKGQMEALEKELQKVRVEFAATAEDFNKGKADMASQKLEITNTENEISIVRNKLNTRTVAQTGNPVLMQDVTTFLEENESEH